VLSAILLGILYLFFGAFTLVFQNNHGFSISQIGLAFLGLLVGMLTGVCTDPIWRRVYTRLVRQREEQGGEPGGSEPEFRLPSTILGAWVVPMALFGKLMHGLTLNKLLIGFQDLGGPRIPV
jgi:drug/metabolite transporter (DMT)-like permease